MARIWLNVAVKKDGKLFRVSTQNSLTVNNCKVLHDILHVLVTAIYTTNQLISIRIFRKYPVEVNNLFPS